MVGMASVAIALPPIIARPGSRPSPTGVQLRDNARLAVDHSPLVASFTDPEWNPVGPTFQIPPEWWQIGNGVAQLLNPIDCRCWPGYACTLAGIAFYRGSQWQFRERVSFDSGGPALVVPGSAVLISAFEIRMDGLPRAAIDEMLKAALL